MSLLSGHNQHSLPTESSDGRTYWRSLEALARTPEAMEHLHREFPKDASEMTSDFSRRSFLSLMAASVALVGGLTGCRRPEEKILPYSRMPDNVVEGVAKAYATSMERGGEGIGLIAESHEGRPVKLEGHPDHPAGRGAIDAQTQAEILNLYDPDRLRRVLQNNKPATMDDFRKALEASADVWRTRQGEGLAFLSELRGSPSFLAQRDRFLQAFPKARWHVWEPVNCDNEFAGTRLALGQPLRPIYDFAHAGVIVSLDADFLGSGPGRLHNALSFSDGRRVRDDQSIMNRLYVVEACFSLTGAKADHRLRMPASQIESFALALAAALLAEDALPTMDASLQRQLAAFGNPPAHEKWIKAVARDLASHPGRALVVAGPGQPPSLHALAAALNLVLGTACVRYVPLPDAGFEHVGDSLGRLAAAIGRGEVSSLVMLGGNPLYDAPADLNLTEAFGKVDQTYHLTFAANETSSLCTWQVPQAHPLESWGDTRAMDGTIALIQPMIAPIYDGLTPTELLAIIAGDEQVRGYDILQAFHRGQTLPDQFEPRWRQILHDGILPETVWAAPAVPPTPDAAAIAQAIASRRNQPQPSAESLELIFQPDPKLFDGRHANNGWLQETPDIITGLCWDNAALLSPATAKALGVGKEAVVRISLGERQVDLAALVLPGLADHVVVLRLGYGRTVSGRVGKGVGVDVYPLRTSGAMDFAEGAQLTTTGGKYPLANVQDHWTMDGRPLVLETDIETLQEEPDVILHKVHHPEHVALWKEHDYTEGHQWGMSIDLSACIGCNACMVACQAENNVPIVGKEQVINGREMHWIRMDRYFEGEMEDPRMVFEPMPCQHCENAPCELVCPVAATTHSPDGLNQMTYNRCIGTRYCANNCPYKVRRFNFFNYTNKTPELVKLAMNPDVTVRSRGVMEKCSFCVQRITRKRFEAKRLGQPLADGDIQTACQQTCPTRAIMFGDINDKNSRVSHLKKQRQDYLILEELNVQPRVSYLAIIRNLNPELEA